MPASTAVVNVRTLSSVGQVCGLFDQHLYGPRYGISSTSADLNVPSHTSMQAAECFVVESPLKLVLPRREGGFRALDRPLFCFEFNVKKLYRQCQLSLHQECYT